MSAQSRFRRMHLRSGPGSGAPRQASAHAAQTRSHSAQASMQASIALESGAIRFGLDEKMRSRVCMALLQLRRPGEDAAARSKRRTVGARREALRTPPVARAPPVGAAGVPARAEAGSHPKMPWKFGGAICPLRLDLREGRGCTVVVLPERTHEAVSSPVIPGNLVNRARGFEWPCVR